MVSRKSGKSAASSARRVPLNEEVFRTDEEKHQKWSDSAINLDVLVWLTSCWAIPKHKLRCRDKEGGGCLGWAAHGTT